jgi:pimeloyl-ACP methyl ester carboxylesterase
LDAYVADLSTRCPRARLALVGYSQGAAVVSEALRRLDAPGRRRVRAVVLIADLYSAGRGDDAITPARLPGGTPRRNGTGSLGPRPAALPGRTADVCLTTDLVCDAPGGLNPAALLEAFSVSVHTEDKRCCAWRPGNGTLPDVLGSDAARRLRDW